VLGEAEQQLAAALRGEIDGHAALAGVEEEEQGAALEAGLVLEERPERPCGVAAHRRLDLDHIRAVVRERTGTERPHDALREVEDSHIVEWHRRCHVAPQSSGGIAPSPSHYWRQGNATTVIRRA
jgi:hypothetical protein